MSQTLIHRSEEDSDGQKIAIITIFINLGKTEMASLVAVAWEKVKLMITRAIDTATKSLVTPR